jgi:hypothetical protein
VAGFRPQGWQIFDQVKQLTPENLYEQINGQASFFLAYDMIRMTTVGYVNSGKAAQFIDLSIYADMQNFKHLEENIIAATTADRYLS